MNALLQEYRSFAQTKSKLTSEQFIEIYDLDLIKK